MEFIVSNDSTNMSVEEVMTIESYIKDGYNTPTGEFFIEAAELQSVINIVKSKFDTTVFDFCNKDNISYILKTDKNITNISGNNHGIYITSFSKTLKDAVELYNILKQFDPPSEENEVRFQTFLSTPNGIDTKYNFYKAETYSDINDRYYPYLDINVLFEQFFGNKESILICCGEPGVGKSKLSTHALKYCLANIKKLPNKCDHEILDDEYTTVNVAYVKSTEILADDSFWYNLSENNYDLVILDDLDFFLTSRNNEINTREDEIKNVFVSHLLSFTDGVQDNKTKFIITSNQPFEGIDEALLRKGRLFDILELRKLTKKEALEIWRSEGLDDESFKKCNFANTILQADLGSEIQKRQNTEVKICPYLLENNISKINTTSKKLGF